MAADLLNPAVRPGDLPEGKKGRHLGKLPMTLTFLVGIALLGGLIYGGINRMGGIRDSGTADVAPTQGLRGNELDDFLNQQPDGFIEPRRKVEFESNLTVDEPAPAATPLPAPVKETKPELTAEEKLYLDFAKKRLTNYLTALESPTETGGTSLSRVNQESARASASGGGNAIDATKLITDRISALTNASGSLGSLAATAAARTEGNIDPNLQDSKIAFLSNEPNPTSYLPSTRTDQVTPYEIKTGTVIPGVMITGINSDLPGQIIAQVREDVYDTATGQYMLIPQGTRLYGTYDSQVSYGQKRALAVWTRLIYPDGSTQELGSMGGSDQAGYAGFKDKVNNHYLRTFGSILLLSMFNAIPAAIDDDDVARSSSSSNQDIKVIPVKTQTVVGIDDNGEPIIVETISEQVVTTTTSESNARGGGDTFSDEFKEGLAATTAQVAVDITRKNINIQPTILIRPGYKMNIMVNKDIAFEKPYSPYR